MRVLDTAGVRDVGTLAFSSDGRRLACGDHGRGLVVHDLAGGPAALVAADGSHQFAVVGFDPAGSVTTITTDGVTRFDPATGGRVGAGPHDPDGPRPVRSFAASADGTRLVTVQSWYPRYRLVCWDAAGGGWERRWSVEEPRTRIDPAVSAAGDRVALIGAVGHDPGPGDRLIVLDAASGETVGSGFYPYYPLHGPLYRPDGRHVVVPHETALVIWDARRPRKPVLVKNDSRKHFTAAAYHPSGRYLFTTSNDATVTVWDADSWVRVRRFDWDVGRLRSVAVSADGLLAAAGSDRGRVVVWDVDV